MAGKVALVTGANKSIGFETVRALAAMGMTVYLGSRDEARGRAAQEALRDEGDVHYIALDMNREQSLIDAIDAIGSAHDRLDILVNNAGVAPDHHSAIDVDLDMVRNVMETNALSVTRLTQLAIPLLRKAPAARIVNVGSGAGSMTVLAMRERMPVRPFAYCLSKIALNGVTVLFAEELRDEGIKVNAANPGLVKSDLTHQMGSRGPAEGARIIVELATLGEDGPTGGFFDEKGPVPW